MGSTKIISIKVVNIKKASRKRGFNILLVCKINYQPVLFVKTAVTAPVVVVVPAEIAENAAT